MEVLDSLREVKTIDPDLEQRLRLCYGQMRDVLAGLEEGVSAMGEHRMLLDAER